MQLVLFRFQHLTMVAVKLFCSEEFGGCEEVLLCGKLSFRARGVVIVEVVPAVVEELTLKIQ